MSVTCHLIPNTCFMISKEEVKHIAKLARISLTEEDVVKFQKELSLILDYFEKLKEVKTSKVTPFFHSVEQTLESRTENLRKDEVRKEKEETVEKLIELAPDKKGRHIKVKGVFN